MSKRDEDDGGWCLIFLIIAYIVFCFWTDSKEIRDGIKDLKDKIEKLEKQIENKDKK